MKKILIALSAALLVFSVSVAFADGEGASLFKSRCQACHGADGGRAPANGVAPVKGQSSADLMTKLQGYKAGTFGGQQKQIMHGIVQSLSDDQLKGLADYASSL